MAENQPQSIGVEQFREIAQETYSGDVAEAQQAIAEAADSLSETAQANAPKGTYLAHPELETFESVL